MGQRIKDIVIVGGGTTGWLAAAILNHRLQWGFGHPEGVRITLIESPDVPTIGVGEATIPAMRQTLAALEIAEEEFIARTQATFKLGVRFDNWHAPDGPLPRSYFHPFSGGVQVAGRNPTASLLAYGVPPGSIDDPQVGNIVGHGVAAATNFKSPKRPSDRAYEGALGYAYHVDAGLFADFLREIAVARGVEHIRDRVIGTTRDERGHIATLQLAEGGPRDVELVIDCSGFRGLLINEAMEEPFVSYADYLVNDRAIAVQVARDPSRPICPATISTAMDAGWRWRIPLQSRTGTGHVYSSAFTDDERALEALLSSLEDAPIVEPRRLRMRVGRCRRSWVGNCVALGLASGFVEPLESTGIQMVDFACRRLLQCLPSADFEPGPIAKFNAQLEAMYDEIRDFLGLHFTLGDRDDTPYWRAMQREVKRSDRLEECLAIWRHALPDVYDPRDTNLFTFWSVSCVLIAKGFYRGLPPVGSDVLPRPIWEAFVARFTDIRTPFLSTLADHAENLRDLSAKATLGESAARAPRPNGLPRLGLALGPSIPVMMPPVVHRANDSMEAALVADA